MELNFATTGDPSHPALLLIHPLGADLHFWDECVAQWRAAFFCVACDLPSAGNSPVPPAPPSVDDQVSALLDVCDTLAIDPAAVVGTAVGGMPVIALARKAPQRVRSLVVTNPGLWITPPARAALADRIAKLQDGGMAAILPDAVDKPFHRLPRDTRYKSYLARFGAQDPVRYVHAIKGILDADVRASLSGLQLPTLVVCGEHEALMDPTHADLLVAAIPGARKVVLAAAAHFLPYQAPDRFAALVAGFVRETLRR